MLLWIAWSQLVFCGARWFFEALLVLVLINYLRTDDIVYYRILSYITSDR
jgi:hypothetical protein